MSPSSKMRWLFLLSLAGLLSATALEPTDTCAVTTFQQSVESATSMVHEHTQHLEELELQGTPQPQAGRGVWASRQDIEAAYRHVIARRPLDPQPWRMLGDLYTAWKRSDEALHAYGEALRRGDNTAAIEHSLAQLYVVLGNAHRSVRHLEDYLARRPDDRAARLTLAQTRIRLTDWESARAELELLLIDDPTDPVAHAWLGLLLIQAEPTTGVSHLQRAIDNPDLAVVLEPVLVAERLAATSDDPAYRLALLGMSFLDLDISALRRNSMSDSYIPASTIELRLKQTVATLALRSLLIAIDHNPIYADAYAFLGQAADQLGWSDWALASLRYALKLAPQSPTVQILTGLYWDRRGESALARSYYETAYSQDEHNVSLCLEIAATYATEGEYTAAEVWLLFAVDIAPDDPRVWKVLTHFYLDSGIGVEESGVAAAARLLELAPDDADAHDLMGWALFLSNEEAQAQISLTRALALDPTLASAHFHLGRLHARQGHYAEAHQDYRRAADYDVEGQLAADLERAWAELPPTVRGEP